MGVEGRGDARNARLRRVMDAAIQVAEAGVGAGRSRVGPTKGGLVPSRWLGVHCPGRHARGGRRGGTPKAYVRDPGACMARLAFY